MAMDGLTGMQRKRIQSNYKAFAANFGEPRIQKNPCRKGTFLVYFPADSESYMQYCEDINYLNGWLYGCVQGALRGEFKKEAV